MTRRRFARVFGLLALTAGSLSVAFAQEKAAMVPTGFRAFVAADDRYEKGSPRNRADKMHDLVTDNALNPVVAVFSRQPPGATPEVSKLAVKLNELATDKELKAGRLGAFVAFLTLGKEYPEDEKRDEAAKQAKDLSAQLKTLAVPFAVAAGKSEQVTAWGIGDKDTLTVVFYREMKVLQRWTFTTEKPLGDDDVKAIAAAVEKELRAKK
jgi:hypothetical protein